MENIKNKRKLKLTSINFRRILATIGVGFTLFTMGGCAKSAAENKAETSENAIGYYNCIEKADESNFVIFNIQNSREISSKKLEEIKEKITAAHNNNLSIGIKLELSDKILDVYCDIDYIKTLINEYSNECIDFPILIGVDSIVKSNLTNEKKEELIETALKILEENGMYVSLFGKDSNLCKLSEEILPNYEDYDACVEMESKDVENIKYQGTYNLYMDKKGVIHSTNGEDLSKVVFEKNNKKNLKSNSTHIVKEGEKLADLEEKYGMPGKVILKYNDIVKLKKGVELQIPSKQLSKFSINIDLSEHNGLDEDFYKENNPEEIWNKFKALGGVILKTNESYEDEYVDSTFELNYGYAEKYGVPVDVYCRNPYYKHLDFVPSFEDFKYLLELQAEKTYSIIKDKDKINIVYLDIETLGSDVIRADSPEALPKEYLEFILKHWYDFWTEKGFQPGIYGSASLYNYIKETLGEDSKIYKEYRALWVATGYLPDNITDEEFNEYGDNIFDDVVNIEFENNSVQIDEIALKSAEYMMELYPEAELFQITENGKCDFGGLFDVNISKNDVEIKIFEPGSISKKAKETISDIVIAVIIVSGVVIGYVILKKKKSNTKNDENATKNKTAEKTNGDNYQKILKR